MATMTRKLTRILCSRSADSGVDVCMSSFSAKRIEVHGDGVSEGHVNMRLHAIGRFERRRALTLVVVTSMPVTRVLAVLASLHPHCKIAAAKRPVSHFDGVGTDSHQSPIGNKASAKIALAKTILTRSFFNGSLRLKPAVRALSICLLLSTIHSQA